MADRRKVGKASREKGARRERDIAKVMGGKRGRAFSGEPDILIPGFYVASVKSRRKMPRWFMDAVEDALEKARQTGLGPLVIFDICAPGKQSLQVIAHVGMSEWLAIHGTFADGRAGFEEQT